MSLLAGDPHDDRLSAAVAPANWINPEPASRYDLVVIGSGTAGLVCAAGAAGLGAQVALIERHLMGGDCLNYGCVPSKALLHSAREKSSDFSSVMERLRRLRADIAVHDSAARFKSLGVDVFFGAAKFTGPEAVAVAGKNLSFRRAVLATGARPAVPEVPGLAESGFLTNESVFTLTALPRRLAIIGAGPIGCELAQAFARLGSAVTVLTDGVQPLPREDADAAALVIKALEGDGVRFLAEAKLQRAQKGLLAFARRGTLEELPCDAILVAVGRAPNVAGLGLQEAGVAFEHKGGIEADDFLRTSNPRIYASGDCCSAFKFTHAADAMSRIVIQNALFPGPRKKVSSLVIPWCTYTDPELARVGVTLQSAGPDAAEIRVDLASVDRAILEDETAGFLKVVYAKNGGRVLGATLVSPHAGETIGELTLAVRKGLTMADLSATIHPYPTQAEAVKKAGDAYMRTKLTPLTKGLLGWWLKAARSF